MQPAETIIGFNEILDSYPTIEHFHSHYVKQGEIIRLLHDLSKVSNIELRQGHSCWKKLMKIADLNIDDIPPKFV